MNLYVDYHSGVPIFRQIESALKAQILSGALAADAPLPSIRNLAKDLRVSVITTKRAYEELERAGLIYTVPGKGCFASGQRPAPAREGGLAALEACLREAISLARQCSLTDGELRTMLEQIMEGDI